MSCAYVCPIRELARRALIVPHSFRDSSFFFVIGNCNLSVSRNRRPWVSRLVGLSVLISQRSTAYISPISWLGAFYFVCNLYEPMNHRRPISAHLGHSSNSFRGLFTIHILIFWFMICMLLSYQQLSYQLLLHVVLNFYKPQCSSFCIENCL